MFDLKLTPLPPRTLSAAVVWLYIVLLVHVEMEIHTFSMLLMMVKLITLMVGGSLGS